jgi:hypothetical protein
MAAVFLFFLISVKLVAAEFIIEDVDTNETEKSWIALPYAFDSASMGLTAGVGAIFSGYLQPQMTVFCTAFVGAVEDVNLDKARSEGIALGISSYRPSFSERLFISFLGSYAYYPNQRLYLNGKNDSKQNLDSDELYEFTPFQTQGYNNWFNLNFRYILPWGNAQKKALRIVKLDRGVSSAGNKANGTPFLTGQTVVGTDFFYTKWTTDKLPEQRSYNTNGARIYLEHDNTDYPDNPSRGYKFKMQYSQDFGIGNSTQTWNALDASFSKYLEFVNYDWSRQNVLALNLWSAYSPSWNEGKKLHPDDPNAVIEQHRPPMWEGARLGGWSRMRAYDSNRFSDKAAFYSALEYRIIPKLNPLSQEKWMPVNIDWFQTVLFAEVGRVAPAYTSELFRDMKSDVGFSLRALAAKVPVRFDMAFGSEGSAMWVMVEQPF